MHLSVLFLLELHSETLEITFSGDPGAVGGEYDGVMGRIIGDGQMALSYQRSPSLSHEEPKRSYSVYSISSFLSAEESLSSSSLSFAPYSSKSLESSPRQRRRPEQSSLCH